MDRWQTLKPDRPALAVVRARGPRVELIGRLPAEAYISILHYLPIPDIPSFALVSRKLADLTRDDRVWRVKLGWLDYRGPGAIAWRPARKELRDDVEPEPPEPTLAAHAGRQPATPPLVDDEFGDFFDGDGDVSLVHDDGFGDFQDFSAAPLAHRGSDPFGASSLTDGLTDLSVASAAKGAGGNDLMMLFDEEGDAATMKTRIPTTPSPKPIARAARPDSPPSRQKPTKRNSVATAPRNSLPLRSVFIKHQSYLLPFYASLLTHTTSSLIFNSPTLNPAMRSRLLSSLVRFTEPLVAPTRSLPQRQTVRRNVQSAMDFFESALISEFERADTRRDEDAMREKASVLWELNGASSNVVQVFVQKREIFYDQTHNPLKNLVKVEAPSGEKVDGIDFGAMNTYMNDVLRVMAREGGLIARVFPPEADVLLYFTERVANDVVSDYITTLLADAQSLQQPLFLLATAATFGQVYRLVDAVLEIEPKSPLVTKERAEDIVFKVFEPHMDDYLQEEGEWIREVLEGLCGDWDSKSASELAVSDPTFLASQNPALVKRNVLAGFTKVLLLPVTIIPKTASMGLTALTTGATGAFNTFAQLGGQLAGNPSSRSRAAVQAPAADDSSHPASDLPDWSSDVAGHNAELKQPAAPSSSLSLSINSTEEASGQFDRMQLLLSLDVALQLIQADRDCLKRVQTFIRYPGTYGRKVRDAMEEIFIILLQTLGEKHIRPGFVKASQQMEAYKPEDHDGEEETVAPLVQFFELVHIGDTIQQMVDVYFDKEMAAYIDKKDFLNTVVREKKRFEASLDDAVAQGLNAGVNVLMSQVEHTISAGQDVRDFTPPEDADLDLQPTKACSKAIGVLQKHCDMLKGSTDKQILEVFYSEVGIRLHGILLKHLKKLIVSISGGFQLISDLNAYHSFVSSLRQSEVTAYFTSLKMVGELFIVDSPRDLSHLVRDVTRYDGTLSTEDLYELVQRRADWKRIEKEVERGLFGFKREDCVVQ